MSEIVIKKRKIQRECIRKVSEASDDEEIAETTLSVVEEVKELQKLRKRPTGISLDNLSCLKDEPKEPKNKDTTKKKLGGYIDAKTLKKELMESKDETQIGTKFATETKKQVEDEPLLNYVEERLAQIKGASNIQEVVGDKVKNSEDALYEMPANIKEFASKKKTEETLSDQMLSGIPEVDLGIETKIRNIEATEEAKMKLLRERLSQKDKGVSEFVPTNVAVNFVQHNRFNIEDTSHSTRRPLPTPKPTPILRVGDADAPGTVKTLSSQLTVSGNEKATDDFHYEKFKRHMRRY